MPLIGISGSSFSQTDLAILLVVKGLIHVHFGPINLLNLKCELLVRQWCSPGLKLICCPHVLKCQLHLKVSGQMEVSFHLLDVGGLE